MLGSSVAMDSIVVRLTFAVALVKLTECGPLAGAMVLPCVDPTAFDDSDQATYFDPSRQLCCSGTVYQVDELRGQSCCGTQVVDSVTHVCCGQEAIPVDGDPDIQCCGGSTVYDTGTHMCCGNNVYTRTHDFNTCCGNYPMDGLQDTCCQVTGPSGTRTMPAKSQGQCCSLEPTYDPAEHICCQQETEHGIKSQVVERGSAEQACCGGQAYDTSQQACCDNQLQNMLNGNTQCCGAVLYNPDNKCCCSDKLFPLGNGQCCGDRPYHPGSASCCNGVLHLGIPEVPAVQGCCGTVSFLATESLCCDGVLQDRAPGIACCGQGTYNAETQLCCSGKVQTKASANDACCGQSSYDPSKETCCTDRDPLVAGELYPVVNGSCCQGAAFLPAEATCCRGNTQEVLYQDVPVSTSTCCGHHLLHPATHLCELRTEHPVRKSNPEDDQVCSFLSRNRHKSYNSRTEVCVRGKVRLRGRLISMVPRCNNRRMDPQTEICCLGKIHPAKDEQGNTRYCCNYGIHSYVPRYQTCCSGRVDNISSTTAECCRNRAYNKATHVCDRSGMIREIQSVQRHPLICGRQPYHPAEQGCCGQQLYGPGQTCCRGRVYETEAAALHGGACCGGVTGYDPAHDLCCGQTVHKNIQPGAVCCGHEAYNPGNQSHTCCQDTLHSSRGGVWRNCSGGTAYDADTEIVCGGAVYPRQSGACCGGALYDPGLEICCAGNVYPKTKAETACCGRVPFDSSDPQARCCDSSLHRAPNPFSSCCGSALFDQRYEHCCLDAGQSRASVLSVAGGRTCNSLGAGNSTVYVQCEGEVRAAGALGSCCDEGFGDINSSVYVCCSGQVLPRLYGDDTKCCGRNVIDAAVERC